MTVSAPAAGSTVSGSVPFTAAVANGTPTQVTFTIDGGASFTEYQSPYVYNGDGNTLDTTTLSNATHTLAARATFSDGSSVSGSETVTVAERGAAAAASASAGTADRHGDRDRRHALRLDVRIRAAATTATATPSSATATSTPRERSRGPPSSTRAEST